MSQKYPVEIAQLFRSGFPSHIANPRFGRLLNRKAFGDRLDNPATARIVAQAGGSSSPFIGRTNARKRGRTA